MHLTDDDLIHHFYAERHEHAGDSDAASSVIEHLQTCTSCRELWMELAETLKLVDEAPAPIPAAGFEQRVWARVQQQLPASLVGGPEGPPHEIVNRPAPRVRWFTWALPLAGAAAVLTLVMLNAGRGTAPVPAARSAAVAPAAPAADAATDARRSRERVLWSAAEDQLEQTEVLLVELMNSHAPSSSDFTFARVAADELVASGRLYRQTAVQSGDLRLAGVLEDAESILVEVARSPERIGKKDFDLLRARIDGDSLLFKVRAVSNEIRERQRQSLTVAEGAL